MDVGLLIARSVFGLLLAAHGCQKLFGWFGGPGLRRTATFFETLGFHPGRLFVVAAALGECGGGILLALGLFQPASAAAVISVMTVAMRRCIGGTDYWRPTASNTRSSTWRRHYLWRSQAPAPTRWTRCWDSLTGGRRRSRQSPSGPVFSAAS